MSDKQERAAALTAAKARLIKEGELYRISVLHAKHQVAESLHPEVLLHGAMDMAVGAVQARVAGLIGSRVAATGGAGAGGISGGLGSLLGLLGGANYKTLMPLAITVGSFISRRGLVKPALGLGAVAAAVGAWIYQRKRKTNL